MRTTLATLIFAVSLLPSPNAAAQAKPAENIKCGPPSWHRPNCPKCTEGGKTYVTVKFTEAAIATAHEGLKDLADPKKEVDAMTELLGVAHVQQKRWTEPGEKKPELRDSYCWASVKALAIKPLKEKGYLLGEYYDGKCKVSDDRCYQVTMTCRKARNEDGWNCIPNLQEFNPKDGTCEGSPTANACECKPDKYWKCGKGATGAVKGGKKGKKR